MPTLHPTPQLTREPWIDLTGTWQFAYDDADVGLLERWPERPEAFDRVIEVPFPPESAASGIADPGFHPVVWYRRELTHRLAPGRRLLLRFGAVDYRASVWVDGQLVVTHEGGHTPFGADVTSALRPGDSHEIVVRAEDRPGDLQQPRGKQDWEEQPHAIWYARTTGIWQPVWVEEVPETYIETVRWTPDVDRCALRMQVRVRRTEPGRPLRLRARLTQHGQVVADSVHTLTGQDLDVEVYLPQSGMSLRRHDVLWSPEHPNLIDADLELLDEGTVDSVRSYTAMRTVRTSDGRFLLNGQPYFLRLVLAQGYWPESHLAAPDADALRREVELAKSLGFNGVRVHQKIEDPRFLHWCDRLGLMVWAEMPAAYEFSERTVQRVTREWLEALDRDYSVPSVIAWVPVNESWGVPALRERAEQRDFVRSLYFLTRSIDHTRPVIGNDGWEQVVSDVLTIHDYSREAATLRARYGDYECVERTLQRSQPGYRSVLLPGTRRGDEPVMVTEFGGITYDVGGDGETWHGYGSVHDRTEFLERYRALVDALLDSPALTGFCYTQLTDTLQEKNGLLTDDRAPKLPPEELCAINRRTSAAVPADAIGAFEFEFGDYPVGPQERVDQEASTGSSTGPSGRPEV
ncbi:glycoside hydrolase family 2 protein [Motilibacter aurantiacus]|uniref:glycoside hydrolase family 2 protein n=1 Tax=Motilibacter aurantiacus TaxID=2714955 RepID=UPI0014088FD5|nr:sugar-binding domain-containing protein [Motilibacter aurantiacus]NHC46701.1 glycoside hydrolase family 2 [Motilibacter aurantiacus]